MMHLPFLCFFFALIPLCIRAENILGFNSGARLAETNLVKTEQDYLDEFELAPRLDGTNGIFNSVRLFTMLREYDSPNPYGRIELNPAIKAAIDTNTTILLGIWCSGTANIQEQLNALKLADEQFGSSLKDLVVGISVGNEDIMRYEERKKNPESDVGKPMEAIIKYVEDVRRTIKGTSLESKPVGHAEPWKIFTEQRFKNLTQTIDFWGANIYPFYQNDGNDANMAQKFGEAFFLLKATANEYGKPVWITETGWPVAGSKSGNGPATAGIENAARYWQEVGCQLFNGTFEDTNVWWYNLRDSNSGIKNRFAVAGDLQTPVFPLACDNAKSQDTLPSQSTLCGSPSVATSVAERDVASVTTTRPPSTTDECPESATCTVTITVPGTTVIHTQAVTKT
ncbi:glucan 1, 3-beta-glucosidase [Colletotrichum karsti]|uniref:Glucan 1, 3-beta-glucosidase n=1 Tax=Colletotrichum karsti TaxID=1095194 RepID=A0A9P6LPW2_9PEZI|nr:glucan 1, 3-beta-glucosidase [Colletotrichum karsti]KAF9880067.1 glucan 1, 3-beta-glucosidase [Colletotrichum karsti]